MDEAIAPAIAMNLPWAAVLGNHDQEGTLSREGVMRHLVGMKNTLSRFNPEGVEIDGYGNYNLEVGGVEGTLLANKSVLNLYFLDSGDYSTVWWMPGYGWIKSSQQAWFRQTSSNLQVNKLASCTIFALRIHCCFSLWAIFSNVGTILCRKNLTECFLSNLTET
jgi:hypothetical protein